MHANVNIFLYSNNMSGGLSGYVVKGEPELCEIALGVFIGFDVGRITELCIEQFRVDGEDTSSFCTSEDSAYFFCLCAS